MLDPFGIAGGQGKAEERAHRRSRHRLHLRYPEMVEQRKLAIDDVGQLPPRGNRAHTLRPVSSLIEGGPGGSVATAEIVDAEDGQVVGVDRQPRTDEPLPPSGLVLLRPSARPPPRIEVVSGGMLAAGQGVEQQDDVVLFGVDLAVKLVGEPDPGQESRRSAS